MFLPHSCVTSYKHNKMGSKGSGSCSIPSSPPCHSIIPLSLPKRCFISSQKPLKWRLNDLWKKFRASLLFCCLFFFVVIIVVCLFVCFHNLNLHRGCGGQFISFLSASLLLEYNFPASCFEIILLID